MIYRTTDLLMPEVARRADRAMIAARMAGHPIDYFETWRSPHRQSELFSQGRAGSTARKVTNADAWESWHQYSVAFDIAAKINGKWSWAYNFMNVIPFFAAEGFTNLAPFEQVHFQITGGVTLERAETITRSLGVQALWAEIQNVLLSVSSHA